MKGQSQHFFKMSVQEQKNLDDAEEAIRLKKNKEHEEREKVKKEAQKNDKSSKKGSRKGGETTKKDSVGHASNVPLEEAPTNPDLTKIVEKVSNKADNGAKISTNEGRDIATMAEVPSTGEEARSTSLSSEPTNFSEELKETEEKVRLEEANINAHEKGKKERQKLPKAAEDKITAAREKIAALTKLQKPKRTYCHVRVIHRFIERKQVYLLYPERPKLFGTPILISFVPSRSTFEDVHRIVWEQVRLLITLPDQEPCVGGMDWEYVKVRSLTLNRLLVPSDLL